MTETTVNDFLEKERLGKLMWKYTIPCVISMLVASGFQKNTSSGSLWGFRFTCLVRH